MKKLFLLAVFSTACIASAQDEIARTLWAEARGEGEEGMRCVATVLWNRAVSVNPYETDELTLVKVAKKRYQFSCWNMGEAPLGTGRTWEMALRIQNEMLGRKFEPLGEWTHYYNPRLASPRWGNKMLNVKVIGNHKFGNLKGEYGYE